MKEGQNPRELIDFFRIFFCFSYKRENTIKKTKVISEFIYFAKIASKCERTHDRRRRRPIFCVSFFFPSPPFFFANRFRIDFYQKYIYLCICVYPTYILFVLFVHGVDRPPNARVLRTDIRTIKQLLMVRIWSR